MVRIHPDPPEFAGAVAQLGEHLLCKQGVVGSIPSSSTSVSCANESGFLISVRCLLMQAGGHRIDPVLARPVTDVGRESKTERRGKRSRLLLIFGSVPRSSVVL